MWGAGGHWQGARACLAPAWLVPLTLHHPPPHPSMAAWLSSAPGNALGFLGAVPKRGEAREDAGLPGEPLLPTAFLG